VAALVLLLRPSGAGRRGVDGPAAVNGLAPRAQAPGREEEGGATGNNIFQRFAAGWRRRRRAYKW
jgi:hypothetical protein